MLMALMLAASAAEAPGHHEIAGRCEYPERVRRHRAETTLALCDALTIDNAGGMATFAFRRKGWGPAMRFGGEMQGRRLNVTRIALRSGGFVEASGTCEIFYANERMTVVSCFARARARSYAANFVVSHING